MFNRKSIYALNKKDPDAIVYMDANEVIVRLTREDFASEKEFLKWKALSDEDYHASEKEAHVYAPLESFKYCRYRQSECKMQLRLQRSGTQIRRRS